MGWATQKEVIRHYHMLTKKEARCRQLAVASVIASLLTPTYFIFHSFHRTIIFIALSYCCFKVIDLLLPNQEIRSTFRRKTRRIGTPKESPTAGSVNKGSGEAGETNGKVCNVTESEPVEQRGNPESTQPDRALYEADSDGELTRLGKLLSSEKTLNRAKAGTSLIMAFPCFFVNLDLFPTLPVLFTTFVIMDGAAMMLLSSFLLYIESLEIEEFPGELREKIYLSIYKKLSFSRGYYFLGEVDGKKIGLPRMMRFLHTLIGGPTGEGKSSALIIPPLLFDADSPGSAVVPDAKSPELYNWVAGRWLKSGKKVYLFDPWHPETIAINPLLGADEQELLTICDVMLREKEEAIGKEDLFFKSRTRYLLYAILKLVQTLKPEYCNLATVFKISESVTTLEKFINTSDDYIQAIFDDFHKLNSETRVNALTSIREKLEPFMEEPVRKAFSKKEFDLSMLFRENQPCLLVLGCPIHKKEPGTKLASLMVNLVINMAFEERTLMKQAIQRGERAMTPNDLYLYLDELRNLKVTGLPDLVSIARETRTHVIASVTDLGFLKYYRDDYGSLMSNFRTRVFMRGLDYDSAKYISDSLGKNRVVSYRLFRGLMVSQESLNLLDPDKVTNIPEDKIICFTSKTNPFTANKVSIYKRKWLQKMKVAPPKEIRKLYQLWGNAKEPLADLELPTTANGDPDMSKIRGSHKVEIKNKGLITEKGHRDRIGGGSVRFPKKTETVEVQPEGYNDGSLRTDEEIAMTADDCPR
jgi:type IV secretory pathway TraG/TraD family ATPase VirD4